MAQIITFDSVVPEGRALGHWHDKALFAVGPLPGEQARVTIKREKRHWAEGVVREYVQTSPLRGAPREDHSASCSPWQGVDYGYQLELKRGMLAETFARPELGLEVSSFVASTRQFGYRNKLEFTLLPDESGTFGLAFHARGSFRDLVAAPDGCVLGSDAMNAAAQALLPAIDGLDLVGVAETLTVRESQTGGGLIAVLLVKEPVKRDWSALAPARMAAGARGIAVVRKVKHDEFETLWSDGSLELTETVGGVDITFPWNAFFQVNVPTFALALDDIMARTAGARRVADLYGGAGTIGLPLARRVDEVTGIEIVPEAVDLANRNAAASRLKNYHAIAVSSEKMDPAVLSGIDTVILDPPRAGLHKRVVEYLLVSRPRRIVYLSCNPVTQVRDVMALAPGYVATDLTGFDFYPGTLHLESLVTLDRRED